MKALEFILTKGVGTVRDRRGVEPGPLSKRGEEVFVDIGELISE